MTVTFGTRNPSQVNDLLDALIASGRELPLMRALNRRRRPAKIA